MNKEKSCVFRAVSFPGNGTQRPQSVSTPIGHRPEAQNNSILSFECEKLEVTF